MEQLPLFTSPFAFPMKEREICDLASFVSLVPGEMPEGDNAVVFLRMTVLTHESYGGSAWKITLQKFTISEVSDSWRLSLCPWCVRFN